jgi:hypothetical protein
MAINTKEMFADASTAEDRADRYKSFQTLMDAPTDITQKFAEMRGGLAAQNIDPKTAALQTLSKSVSADVLESIGAAMGMTADVVKDLTLTSPLSTGYVAYDLEAPAKLLAPRLTPLRNRIPRGRGVGTAHRYKRITGHTGTGTGGVGNIRPGLTDSTTTTFGSLNFIRGAKISYAGDEASVPYLQFGLSSSVPFSAQFSGQGFQDIRATDRSALLWSSLLMEERLLLGGRGTAAGFAGALTTPGTPTLTVRNATTGETGNTANIATLYVYVTAATAFGETVAGSANTTGMSAATGKVVDVQLTTLVTGAQQYKVYAGTVNAAASVWTADLTIAAGASGIQAAKFGNGIGTLVVASGTAGAVTINFTGGGTGGAPIAGSNPPASATDSSALDYDGLLTICSNPSQAGYVRHLGSTFSSNPGDDYNQVFVSLYDSVKADPDEIFLYGGDRKQMSDLIKLNSNSSSYRITIEQEHSATIGAVVTGLQNEVTGKMVDFTVHPWIPQGISPIISWQLPLQNSEVSDVWKAFNVQDYMSLEWPVLQLAYEASSYWYGTFLCYAAAWNGCLTGIVRK